MSRFIFVLLCVLMMTACGGGSGSSPGAPPPGGEPPPQEPPPQEPPPVERHSAFFSASDINAAGRRLWRTDGTEAGTTVVHADLVPDFGATTLIARTTLLSGMHYLAGAQPGERSGLWATDGMASGTYPVLSALYAGPYDVRDLVELDASLFFTAAAEEGRDLWRSDGTGEGTARIGDLTWNDCTPDPEALRVVAGYLLFFGNVGCNGEQALLRLDSTDDSSLVLRRFGSASVGDPVVLGGRWITHVREGNRHQLIAVDPAARESAVLVELPALGSLAIFERLTVAGDHLYFIASGTTHGRELWVTDGTAAGTRMVEDKTPGPGNTQFQHMQAAGDKLVYVAPVLSNQHRIWVVDSPESSARAVFGAPATGFSFPELHIAHDGTQYFYMVADDMVRRLCRVDLDTGAHGCLQTAVSPALSFGMLALDDALLFVGFGIGTGSELWRADFQLGGAELVRDICPGSCSSHW